MKAKAHREKTIKEAAGKFKASHLAFKLSEEKKEKAREKMKAALTEEHEDAKERLISEAQEEEEEAISESIKAAKSLADAKHEEVVAAL